MNHLTSVNLGNFLKDYNLEDSLRMIRAAGFDGVDFSLWYYSYGEHAALEQDDWRDWVHNVRRLLDENNLLVLQAHAYWQHPWQLNEDFSYTLPGEIFQRNIEACHILGCRKLVFHPIQHFFPLDHAEETRRKVIDANAAWFSSLLPAAEKFNVELLVENIFDYRHIQSPDAPPIPLSRCEDILKLLEIISHPLMKTCLDTGHANIAGDDVPRMIRLYGNKLSAMHMQDNFGKIYPIYEDIHLFPGTGRLDWQKIFAALQEISYQGHLNMEISAGVPGKPYDIQLLRLQQGRELLLKMAETYTK